MQSLSNLKKENKKLRQRNKSLEGRNASLQGSRKDWKNLYGHLVVSGLANAAAGLVTGLKPSWLPVQPALLTGGTMAVVGLMMANKKSGWGDQIAVGGLVTMSYVGARIAEDVGKKARENMGFIPTVAGVPGEVGAYGPQIQSAPNHPQVAYRAPAPMTTEQQLAALGFPVS